MKGNLEGFLLLFLGYSFLYNLAASCSIQDSLGTLVCYANPFCVLLSIVYPLDPRSFLTSYRLLKVGLYYLGQMKYFLSLYFLNTHPGVCYYCAICDRFLLHIVPGRLNVAIGQFTPLLNVKNPLCIYSSQCIYCHHVCATKKKSRKSLLNVTIYNYMSMRNLILRKFLLNKTRFAYTMKPAPPSFTAAYSSVKYATSVREDGTTKTTDYNQTNHKFTKIIKFSSIRRKL